jgi:thioesterase domain-containing protein
MARQLTDAGHTVELLVLLEPSLHVARDSRTARSRAFAGRVHGRSVAAFPGNGLQARMARALRVTRAGIQVARHHVDVSTAGLVTRTGVPQHEVFLQLHTRMLRPHRPKPYRGRAVVLASSQYLDQAAAVLDHLLPAERNGGRRREVVVAGEHLDLVREPNVAQVARVLQGLLQPIAS